MHHLFSFLLPLSIPHFSTELPKCLKTHLPVISNRSNQSSRLSEPLQNESLILLFLFESPVKSKFLGTLHSNAPAGSSSPASSPDTPLCMLLSSRIKPHALTQRHYIKVTFALLFFLVSLSPLVQAPPVPSSDCNSVSNPQAPCYSRSWTSNSWFAWEFHRNADPQPN